MKKIFYLCLLWTIPLYTIQAQINFRGCSAVLGDQATGAPQTYILTQTGTVGTRNTYSSPVNNCIGGNGGLCQIIIIWTGSRWEIQLTDGSTNFGALYFNTSTSAPNPPDLTLGTWVENTTNTGGACGGNGTSSISTLSGDVQNTTGGGAPEIDLQGNAVSIADGDVTPAVADGTNFGNVALGSNGPRTFTIRNTGTANLTVNSIALSGAQAGDFAISGITLPATIAAGANTTFTVTFTPSAIGARNATVTVNNDDADEAVYDFAIRGDGTGIPEIDVQGNAVSIADGDVTPTTADGTDYGTVIIGNNSPQTFTINNSGTADLAINSITLSGAQVGDFVISGITLPATVATGANTTFTVTFTPSAVGARNATVTVNNDDPDEAIYDFAIRGTGVGTPEIDVQGNTVSITDGDITPSPADGTDYGTVATSSNNPQTFTIDNSGTADLTINSITLSGAQAGDFAISGITLPATIAVGANTTFTVTFTPSVAGVRNATVTINNDDIDEAVYDFAIRGTGTGNPEIDVLGNGISILDGDLTPDPADGTNYGSATISSNTPQTFTIDNTTGTDVLNLTAIGITGAQAGDFAISGITLPTTVAAGATTTFTVTFTPSGVGIRNAIVTINNDDADEGVYDFAVQGNGTPLPEVAITEWLSNPSVDDATDEWVEIYNYGTVPVDLQNWRLRDEDVDNNIITNTSFILQPGAYAILARNKASFENDWLNCPNNPSVLQVAMILGNTSDEIILEDALGNLIWQVSYIDDESTGRATWYTETNYTPTQWGTKAAPGVRRNGNDITTGTLGYERNNSTTDPLQITAVNGDIGSPLNGQRGLSEIVRGNALAFAATNEEATAANSADFEIGMTTDLTIEAWVFPNNALGGNTFKNIARQSGPGFGASGYSLWLINNILEFEHLSGPRRDRYRATTTLPANQWSHVAVVMDRAGTSVRLYVNGVLDGTYVNGNIAFSASFPTNTFRIGSTANGLDGNIDELRVWHQARTETEIRENMHLTLEGCETNLIAYYQFNEASGSTVITDATGGNDATLNGAINPATAWLTSGVNVGQDAQRISNSQTLPVPAGASTQNFAAANLSMNYTAHSIAEDVTVTYQEFAPNDVSSIPSVNVIQQPMWTINKATATSTQTVDLTFTYPAGALTGLKDCDYRLYHRPMFSDGAWTQIAAQASAFTATTVTFSGITVTGQFVVVTEPIGAPDLTRGRHLNFDGVNAEVGLGNIPAVDFDFDTPFSIETWVRVDAATTSNGNFLTKFDGGTLVGYTFGYIGSNGAVNFGITNFGVFQFFEVRSDAGFDIRDGQWHHVAVTYDGSGSSAGAQIYVDGINRTTVALAGTVNTSISTAAPAIIGNFSGGTEYLEGDLDELRVWSAQRNETEIRENMHLTQTGCETDLVAYYQFNEAPGATVLPDLARGNNGILSGINVVTSWQASGVNTGNDAPATSNSQTLNIVAVTGTRQATFNTANLYLELIDNANTEDYTVTYQAYTPNSIVGATGTTIIQNPVWTINKATTVAPPRMNIRFDYPTAPFTVLDGSKYRLYWRPMNSDGPWTIVKNQARTVTNNSILFSSIYQLGQFMVVQASEVLISDVRGDMYDFDGTDDYIQLPGTWGAVPEVTVEAWVKIDAGTGFQAVLSSSAAEFIHFQYGSAGSFIAYTDATNITFPVTLVPFSYGNWQHVAMSIQSGNSRLYLNGVQVGATNTATFTNVTSSSNVSIARGFGGARFLDGSVDEVRVWYTARTQAEIRENMHLTLKGTEPGLVSYYQFNNDDPVGTANGVKDAMGISDGTTMNMLSTNQLPSEVAVAGGVSERITVNTAGVATFAIPNVNIDFGSSPNGEIVVSRLKTEKPTGWQSIGSDVDDEYFVIWNYGTNQTPVVNGLTFSELTNLNASTLPSDVGLYRRGSRAFGPTWGSSIAAANSVVASFPGTADFVGAPLTNGFSQFVIAQTGGSDLPIELVNFDAERQNATEVALWWTTAMELDNRGFELQRMLEGELVFTPVGWVDGKGSTTTMTRYNFVDDNASTDVSYYRLKQVDFDGTVSYSPIRAVEGTPQLSNSNLVLFPNPASDEVRVRLSDLGKVTRLDIQLSDAQGRIWRQAEIDLNGATTLDWTTPVEDLVPGMYVVTIRSWDGTREWQEKLMVR